MNRKRGRKEGWKEGKEGEGERVRTYRERKRKRKGGGGVKKKREWQNDERVNWTQFVTTDTSNVDKVRRHTCGTVFTPRGTVFTPREYYFRPLFQTSRRSHWDMLTLAKLVHTRNTQTPMYCHVW